MAYFILTKMKYKHNVMLLIHYFSLLLFLKEFFKTLEMPNLLCIES